MSRFGGMLRVCVGARLEIEINVIEKRRRARQAHLVVAEWTFPGTRWETLKSSPFE